MGKEYVCAANSKYKMQTNPYDLIGNKNRNGDAKLLYDEEINQKLQELKELINAYADKVISENPDTSLFFTLNGKQIPLNHIYDIMYNGLSYEHN